MPPINRNPQTAITVQVTGFADFRRWLQRLIKGGIVKCDSCSNVATHTHFTDQAEWYNRCEDHRYHEPQWTGSTRWEGNEFSVPLVNDGTAWVDTLEREDREKVALEVYDATNYYDLLPPYPREPYDIYTFPDNTAFRAHTATIYELTDGTFAYEEKYEWPRSAQFMGIIGGFDTAEDVRTELKTLYKYETPS